VPAQKEFNRCITNHAHNHGVDALWTIRSGFLSGPARNMTFCIAISSGTSQERLALEIRMSWFENIPQSVRYFGTAVPLLVRQMADANQELRWPAWSAPSVVSVFRLRNAARADRQLLPARHLAHDAPHPYVPLAFAHMGGDRTSFRQTRCKAETAVRASSARKACIRCPRAMPDVNRMLLKLLIKKRVRCAVLLTSS